MGCVFFGADSSSNSSAKPHVQSLHAFLFFGPSTHPAAQGRGEIKLFTHTFFNDTKKGEKILRLACSMTEAEREREEKKKEV